MVECRVAALVTETERVEALDKSLEPWVHNYLHSTALLTRSVKWGSDINGFYLIAGNLPARHIETFNSNSYFKGVNIPEPEKNVCVYKLATHWREFVISLASRHFCRILPCHFTWGHQILLAKLVSNYCTLLVCRSH